MRPAADNALVIAQWFLTQSEQQGRRLQPGKIHALLYLAQYAYAHENKGRVLMPAAFVAFRQGPREANLYEILQLQSDTGFMLNSLPPLLPLNGFLDWFWRKTAHHGFKHLIDLIENQPPYAEALAKGEGSLIPLEAILQHATAPRTSDAGHVVTADGRRLARWVPPARKAP